MDCRLLTYRVKSWLKFQLTAWNTGGEGVHSPYLFEWVRTIMSDKHAYYVWRGIESCRSAMLRDERTLEYVDYGCGRRDGREESREKRVEMRVCDIAKGSLARKRYAQMLFRLVNWLGRQSRQGGIGDVDGRGMTIVELGTSLGITTAYLAAADSRNKVVTYEGCEAVAQVAKDNWQKLKISNIECIVGEIDAARLRSDLPVVDVAFIDANHTYAGTREYFNVLADKVHAKSVIVVDDIHHSAEMERAWKEICADARVSSTMDLYQMGLVFFDANYWRRNYTMRL